MKKVTKNDSQPGKAMLKMAVIMLLLLLSSQLLAIDGFGEMRRISQAYTDNHSYEVQIMQKLYKGNTTETELIDEMTAMMIKRGEYHYFSHAGLNFLMVSGYMVNIDHESKLIYIDKDSSQAVNMLMAEGVSMNQHDFEGMHVREFTNGRRTISYMPAEERIDSLRIHYRNNDHFIRQMYVYFNDELAYEDEVVYDRPLYLLEYEVSKNNDALLDRHFPWAGMFSLEGHELHINDAFDEYEIIRAY